MDENSFLHNWDCRWLSPGQWDALGCVVLECPVCGRSVTYAGNTIMYVSVCGGCGAMAGPASEDAGYIAWYHAEQAWALFQQAYVKSHRYN